MDTQAHFAHHLKHKSMLHIDKRVEKELYQMWKWEQEQHEQMVAHANKLLDMVIRHASERVTPPIKGKITPGKLKWRGMRLCSQNKGHNGIYYWIEQRGKIVGEKLLITVNP